VDELKPEQQDLLPNNLNANREPGLSSAMFLYLFVFTSLMLIGSYLQALHFEYGMIATQVIVILLPALWYWRRFGIQHLAFARLKPLQKEFIPAIIILATALWLINIFIAAGIVGNLIELGYQPLVVIEPPSTWQQYLGYLLVLCVFAGICEEVLFRGTIMPSLEKYGLVPAIVFSSLLFALLHGSLLSLISTFSLGVMMAVIVIKTGSLWGGILYHMLNNFYAATYLFLAGGVEADPAGFNLQIYMVLLPFLIIGFAGMIIGLRLLNKASEVDPLLKNRKKWMPSGWPGWPFWISVFLFLLVAAAEIALGFNWIDL
jgi:uncharacterized protein